MKVKNLKNYGKSLLEMTGSVPHEVIKESSDLSSEIMEQFLNVENMEHFTSYLSAEKERMLKQDMSDVNEKGLNSEDFIYQQIEWAASFSAISKMMKKEEAVKLFRKIAEQTYPKLFSVSFPTSEDIGKFDDPFSAFKEWFSVMMDANKKAGLFDYETIEDNQDALQINCIWCVWYEIYKQVGMKEACIPVCYADDIFYPNYFRQTGISYKRSGTLGWGDDCCDFRFERKK